MAHANTTAPRAIRVEAIMLEINSNPFRWELGSFYLTLLPETLPKDRRLAMISRIARAQRRAPRSSHRAGLMYRWLQNVKWTARGLSMTIRMRHGAGRAFVSLRVLRVLCPAPVFVRTMQPGISGMNVYVDTREARAWSRGVTMSRTGARLQDMNISQASIRRCMNTGVGLELDHLCTIRSSAGITFPHLGRVGGGEGEGQEGQRLALQRGSITNVCTVMGQRLWATFDFYFGRRRRRGGCRTRCSLRHTFRDYPG